MTNRIRPATRALALVLAAATAACSDAAPSTAPVPGAPRAARQSGQAAEVNSDTAVVSFTYDPRARAQYILGDGHVLDIPAGSVCDPATSGYGPGLWDAPCAPLAAPARFTVKSWWDRNGSPRLVVTPDVRFVPGADVTLRVRDVRRAKQQQGAIGWCPTGSPVCVDEAVADSALVTQYDARKGYLYRRLKHFSGYHIILGREETLDGGY